MDGDKADDNTYQAEVAEEKNQLRKTYGWWLLAREVSEFTHLDFFSVMDRSAMEIFGMVKIIEARNKINEK